MAMDQKTVEYVARLARLGLSEEEKKNFTGQLDSILGYVEKLKEADTSQVEPTAHPFAAHTVWREDKAEPFGDSEPILKNAPERDDAFFKVRKVIE